MITCFYLATIQLLDKSFQKTIWFAFLSSACLFFTLWLIIGYAFSYTPFFSVGWFFGVFDWVFTKITGMLGSALIFTLTWFLFPSVLTLIITFFLERIILVVEEKHYPDLDNTRKQNLIETLGIIIKFTLLSIFLNILVIPLYIIFLFLGPANLIIFYILNGYLLGKEYFELVAHRRFSPSVSRKVYVLYSRKIFWAGVINAFLMTIPILNMVAPIISTAAMVHLIQRFDDKSNEISS